MFLLVSCTMTGMSGGDWKRAAKRIIERRTQLGMKTTTALAERAGLTPRMLGDVENVRRTNFAPGTIMRIEIALEWQPGSIADLLTGGEPTPLIPATDPTGDTGGPSGEPVGAAFEDHTSLAKAFIANQGRLLIDLTIDADQVDQAASGIDTDVRDMDDAERLVAEVGSLLIDIDRLTQRIHEEALKTIGNLDALRILKADALRRRRERRLGRRINERDLLDRMLEITSGAISQGLSETEALRRFVDEIRGEGAYKVGDERRFSDASDLTMNEPSGSRGEPHSDNSEKSPHDPQAGAAEVDTALTSGVRELQVDSADDDRKKA